METNYNTQSSDDANHTNMPATMAEGTTSFAPSMVEFEDSRSTVVSSAKPTDLNYVPGPLDDGLNKFLSRPVKVLSGLTNDYTSFTLNPLKTYLANPSVAAKTRNYQLIKATVCVRYAENAIPFVYGCKQLAAVPYFDTTDQRFTNVYANSNCQCQYTNPAVGNPIVFRLPYISSIPADEIRVINVSPSYITWHILMRDVKAYARADSATVPNTSFSVHVWLEDVQLSVPLATDAVYQSEYKGVISTPATIVSDAARTLSQIPVLRPFTQPVEHASTMISNFARNFGFSRPIQLEPPPPVLVNGDHNMSISTYVDNCQKLVTDPKQGVSVDTAMMDGSNLDLLALKSLTSRETLLDSFLWQQTDPIGAFIKQIPVTPCAIRGDVNACTLPAVAVAALPFRMWHGSMKYRIKVVSSSYHRGRLRVYWSPTLLNTASLTEDIFNQLESKLIDIESNKETTIDVFWAKNRIWEQCQYVVPPLNTAISGQTNSNKNGFLYFRVSQTLSAPVSTADVLIMIFTSGGDDLEFAGRTTKNISLFHLLPRYQYNLVPERTVSTVPFNLTATLPTDLSYQSEMHSETSNHMTFNSKNSITDMTNYTTGERITSLRELCKTWHLWESKNIPLHPTDRLMYRISFPGVPFLPGGNVWTNPGLGNGYRLFDSPITLCNQIFRYFKGSIRYKIVFDSLDVETLQVEANVVRVGGGTYGGPEGYHTQDTLALTPTSIYENYGVAVAKSGNSITFEVPFQHTSMFYSLPTLATPNYNGNQNQVLIRLFTPPESPSLSDVLHYRAYISIGEDANWGLYYGLGVCRMYNVFADGGPPPGLRNDEPNTQNDEPISELLEALEMRTDDS